jgi:rubrerythrin
MSTTLNGMIDVAIRDELDAQAYYLAAAEKTPNAKLKNFFQALAKDEQGHERILRGVKEMALYDGSIEVDETELHKIEGAHIIEDEPTLDDINIEEAMEFAMKKEDKASKVYGQMADTAPHEEIKQLFASMASDERRHFNSIEIHYKMHTGQMGQED